MLDDTPTTTTPRRWQDVAKERGIPLRVLGDLIGRPLSTMLAYSMGRRRVPQDLLFKIRRVLGEDVQ